VTIGTNQVVTFAQQPAGTFAGTGPVFSAALAVSQSFTTSTWTKAVLDVKTFDTSSFFNNTGSTSGGIPAYAFKPTLAGYYQINANSILQSASSNVTFSAISIYKSGAGYSYGTYATTPNTNASGVLCSDIIYFNGTTDYIEVYIFAAGTSPFATTTRFSGVLVRAA
jgi:hypothetical protein